MFFEDGIDKKLDAFIRTILSADLTGRTKIKHRHSILNGIKLRVIKDIERTKHPKLQIDADKCSRCGLCAAKCPDNNLGLKEGYIQIENDSGCLHCLRCINHCHSNAITFGKLTIGENRYTIKLCDQLFKKAASGEANEYWRDFKKIVRLWRKNTTRYWLKHRKTPEI